MRATVLVDVYWYPRSAARSSVDWEVHSDLYWAILDEILVEIRSNVYHTVHEEAL